MNTTIKPYFDQLIEDREYNHSTGPAPKNVVAVYIEELELLLREYVDDFDVIIEGDVLEIEVKLGE